MVETKTSLRHAIHKGGMSLAFKISIYDKGLNYGSFAAVDFDRFEGFQAFCKFGGAFPLEIHLMANKGV